MKNDSLNPFVPSLLAGGVFIIACAFAPILSIGAGTLAMLGACAGGSAIHLIRTYFSQTDLEEFFRAADVSFNDRFPRVIKHRQIEDGVYEYRIKMPPGMCSEDFEKIKLRMEQYLNAYVTISYERWDGSLVITTNRKELQKTYNYEYIESKKPLEVAIGRDTSSIIMWDIFDAPHTLIGSTTGGGKSSFLRSIITSLILKERDDIVLNLVDFQEVELPIFEASKYVNECISEPMEFKRLLAELERESVRRMKLFRELQVRDITKYNQKVKPKDRLPYIVTVVDEYVTLAQKEYAHIQEDLMQRLSKDRKAGFRFILSTQYPSTKVIDNTLKEQLSCRVCFKVVDNTASMVILDRPGGEDLRGKGHGLIRTDDGVREFQGYWLDEDAAIDFISSTFVDKAKKKTKKAGVVLDYPA